MSGDRYLGDGAADRRVSLYDGRAVTREDLPFGGDIFRDHKMEVKMFETILSLA